MSLGPPQPPMIGRQAELIELRRAVDLVDDGVGGVALIIGEPGIGKSRLLDEVSQYAADRAMFVLSGAAIADSGTYRAVADALAEPLRRVDGFDQPGLRPYLPVLRRVVPAWTGSLATDADLDQALMLGEGLLRLVGLLAAGHGCLLVLEDLHWADGDTMALLSYLARAARTEPVLVLASAREEPAGSRVSDLVARPEILVLPLGPLPPDDVVRLAEARRGAVLPELQRAAVLDKSDGVPLLVEELVDLASSGDATLVPPTLAALVAKSLAALDPDHRRVLWAAAVLGADPDWTLLPQILDRSAESVSAALLAADVHLILTGARGTRWRHALTRDAVVATVPVPDRAAFARRAAQVLQARGGEDILRAAQLSVEAGDNEHAARTFLDLAQKALVTGALRSCGDLLDRAERADKFDRALTVAIAIERVRLSTARGEAGAALTAGEAALGSAQGAEHAELCLELAHAAVVAGRWASVDRLLERTGRPEDPRSLALAAEAAYGSGEPQRARVAGAAAAARAERDGPPIALVQALLVVGRCALLNPTPDVRAARTAFARAAQVAAESGLTSWQVTALLAMASIELEERATSPSLAQARQLAHENGLLASVVAADMFRIECIGLIDGPRAGEVLARQTADLAGRLGLPALQAMTELFLAASYSVAGDEDVREVTLAAAAARDDAPVEARALAPAIRALPAMIAHDAANAVPLLDCTITALSKHRSGAPVQMWGAWALLRTVTADRDVDAREELRRAPAARRRLNLGALYYADAIDAGREGRSVAAAALLHAGDDCLADHHWWRRVLRPYVLEAAVVDGWGDPVPQLRADLVALEESGEAQLAATCRDLLRRAGAPVIRGRGDSAVPPALRKLGVTSREMDVLNLVVLGLTNRQVGERLFLSRRTIDTHVANLLAKTGAADRTELRRLVGHATR